MKTIRIKFPNNSGEEISGRLEMPLIGEPTVFAIFAHCFTCTKNLTAVGNISRALTQQGIAVLRFDFTGLGQSGGEFEDTNFSSNVDDLIAACQYLSDNYHAPQLLVGHSLGGAAVLMAASKISTIKAVATIGAPSEPNHVKHLIQAGIPEIESKGEAQVSIGGRPFNIKKQFLEDLEKNLLADVIPKLNASVLVMHSPQDLTVSIDNASYIFNAAKHPRSFVSLDGADHLLTDPRDSLYAGDVIGSWSRRYLMENESEFKTKHGSVLVRTGDTYTTEITTAHHQLLADEPKSVGGNNLGPTPYGLLLSALGSCIGITLRMYINRKGWDVDEINIHLNHEKIHAEDCKECETDHGKVDQIEVKIEFEGNIDESQTSRLMEIAGKCPVHKTLKSEVRIIKSLLS